MKIKEKLKSIIKTDKVPRFAKIVFAISAVSLILLIIFIASESFADFFNKNISHHFRILFAYLTNAIPFSFAEMLLISLPFILAFLIWLAATYFCDTWKDTLRYLSVLVSVLLIVFNMFVWSFAAGYHGSTLDKKLEIDKQEVSAKDLYETALVLIEGINEYSDSAAFAKDNFSHMPFTKEEMNDILLRDYKRLCEEHDFINTFNSRLKGVILSEAMSYTHITGVYSFFTGEANINVNFPDYTIPFTAAHELAHQRGIAREDEANFIAFLVCINSENAYIRYSAYLNMYEYVASALYRADKSLYSDAVSRINTNTRYEMIAYNDFFEKYENSTASKVSGAVNNTHLILNGTEGTKSYGLVVDLAVAYYRNRKYETSNH